MFTYLLSYDPLGKSLNNTQLLAFIRDNRKVAQWYSPYLGTYLLKSGEPLFSLQETLSGIFDEDLFVIAPINAGWIGGRLPLNMWPWINGTAGIPLLPNSSG
jgi:hypothetical protein